MCIYCNKSEKTEINYNLIHKYQNDLHEQYAEKLESLSIGNLRLLSKQIGRFLIREKINFDNIEDYLHRCVLAFLSYQICLRREICFPYNTKTTIPDLLSNEKQLPLWIAYSALYIESKEVSNNIILPYIDKFVKLKSQSINQYDIRS